MKFPTIITLAACLPLESTLVQSFQVFRHPITTTRVSTKSGAVIVTPTPSATFEPTRSTWTPPASHPTDLYSVISPENDDEEAKQVEEMQDQVADISESLERAKIRQDEARKIADRLREERTEIASQTDLVIARLKGGLSDVMSDLSDQIETVQDERRKKISQTRAEISNIEGEVKEQEAVLKAEISDLESCLTDLRKETEVAVKERDLLNQSIERDTRIIRAASRKELEEVKSVVFQEKKRLRVERWALESRIRRADADAITSLKELKEQKLLNPPRISTLKEELMKMKRKMAAQVDELKEQILAKEMFFDQSLKGMKGNIKSELGMAKSVSEGEISDEDRKLENATSYYKLELEAQEKELVRTMELTTKPVEFAGKEAVSEAKKNRIALYQEKMDAISQIKADSAKALREVAESHETIQDQYDAEYENEQWNLKQEDATGKRLLQKEDKKRRRRTSQVRREKEQVARKLAILLQDEKVAAERDYWELTKKKSVLLTESASQVKKVEDEIINIKSNTIFAQDELDRLENNSRQNQHVLSELEEERASFRKQVRRTVVAALGRMTCRGEKAKK